MKWTPMKILFVSGAAVAAVATALAGGPGTAPVRAAAVAAPSASGEIAAFYRSRGGAPLWLSPTSGGAAQQLVQLLATAQADNLNSRRYNMKGLTRAVQAASTGDPRAVQQAEVQLSAAFVAYARDQKRDPGGVIYVDPELKPKPPS